MSTFQISLFELTDVLKIQGLGSHVSICVICSIRKPELDVNLRHCISIIVFRADVFNSFKIWHT